MTFILHDYQQTLVDKARQAYADGYKAPCVVAPCGAGKSVIISEIARMTALRGKKILFLVHRKELIDQIRETFEKNDVDMNMVTFGMVQTIVRRLDRQTKPDLIITDENHHGLASSYRKIYDHFSDVLRLGFTATPIRLNGDGLGDVNDILIEEVDAEWLIDHEFLSPYKYYAPSLIDRSELKLNSMREFSSKSMDQTITKKIYGDVIKHYRSLADDEQAIAYCHSIQASQDTCQAFNDHGIPAQHIDGNTPRQERDEIIQGFRDGEIKILTNVDLIGEGFDVPDCSTVIMLRPTQSLSLFIQQSMRGMRYKAGKTSIIIDHVDNVSTHGLPDSDRVWALQKKKKSKQQEASIKVKQCTSCFMAIAPSHRVCPNCGHEFIAEQTEYETDEQAELKQITKDDISIRMDFREPEDCKSMKELSELAKSRGYKPGWAFFQAKRLGILN